MSDPYLFDPAPTQAMPVQGSGALFPIRRIFCVGRNYAAHAAEMGNEVDREAPFYFTKSAQAYCPSGAEIAYPAGTGECHYEMEFVVAIGSDVGGDAMQAVWGYGCGIDLTRRDLQGQAKAARRPWDLGKDFENSAILGPLSPRDAFGEVGDQRITLEMDGGIMQAARLSDMVWSVPEILAHLSGYYRLRSGDVIMTGTPAGVGPVNPGSRLHGEIEGLEPVKLSIARD